MKKTVLTFVSILFVCLTTLAQKKKNLNIDYMLRGNIYAHTSIIDTLAFGGHGSSNNFAKVYNDSMNFSETGFFLKIDTAQTATYDEKYNGYKFFITNKTDSTVKLDASDSRLYAVAEVLYQGVWVSIEYLPSSWCGNSYHHVYLKKNEYWEFIIPKFSGKIKTKLRYKLRLGKNQYIYSNEIYTYFNTEQLTEKKTHTPSGLMDPYND